MEMERYMVLSPADNTCSEVILSKTTDIKIKVYRLQHQSFTPNPKEIQLYSEYHGQPLAFETEGLSSKNGFDIFMAVKWYARQQLDCPEMLIRCGTI
jgi:hypothetical protein